MNTQQLEARSNNEREDVEETLGQIHKRLSPGQLVDEVLAYTKDGGGEFITNLGRQATNNPLPVSLIGAGLAWFLFSKGGSQSASHGSAPPLDRARGTYSGGLDDKSSETESGIADVGREAVSSMSDGVSSASGAVRDGLATASERLGNGADAVTEAISSASQSVKGGLARGASAIGETAGLARRGAGEFATSAAGFLKDQPLVLLGAALALGAAVGASLPETDVENEMLGETSAGLKSQVQEAASQMDKAQAAGEHFYGEVKERLGDEVAQLAEGTKSGHAQAQDGPIQVNGGEKAAVIE